MPLSPNRVQAGHSQDVPDEGSLFHVSPVSPGFLFRPLRATQQLPHDGVLLPTMLDSPLSLPVYALPSGSALMPGQSLVQMLLASGTSSHPGVGSSAVAPPMDMEDCPLLKTGLPGCPYRFAEDSAQPFSDGNPAFGLQLHHPRFVEFVGAPQSARLLCRSPTFWVDQLGREQAMAAAVNLQWDTGIMLSNLQVMSQFVTSLHRMSSEMMVLGIGQMVFPQAEDADFWLHWPLM